MESPRLTTPEKVRTLSETHKKHPLTNRRTRVAMSSLESCSVGSRTQDERGADGFFPLAVPTRSICSGVRPSETDDRISGAIPRARIYPAIRLDRPETVSQPPRP